MLQATEVGLFNGESSSLRSHLDTAFLVWTPSNHQAALASLPAMVHRL